MIFSSSTSEIPFPFCSVNIEFFGVGKIITDKFGAVSTRSEQTKWPAYIYRGGHTSNSGSRTERVYCRITAESAIKCCVFCRQGTNIS